MNNSLAEVHPELITEWSEKMPPRPMMGIDSCGMLISAVHEEDGREGLNLLMVDDRIPAGAKLY